MIRKPFARSATFSGLPTVFAPVFIALLAFTTSTRGDDWPQWRGGDLTSVSKTDSVPAQWNKDKNMLWRVPMPGAAGSSPIVWKDKVFVSTIDGKDLYLMCIGLDGEVQWKKQLEGSNSRSRMDHSNSASASPFTDGEHVWVMMGNGFLSCLTVDGDLVWKKDLQKEYGKFDIQFGMTSTPILDNGKIYLALMHGNMRSNDPSVGQVIALNAKTGDEVWMQLRKTDGVAENKHSYASPTIYRDSKREFLVTHGADYVMGHSLEDGSELWRCGGFNPKGRSYNRFLRLVSSPSCGDGIIVVPTAKRGAVLGLKVGLTGDVTPADDADQAPEEVFHWRLRSGTPDVASPLIYNGLVYLAGERGDLTCLNVETGEVYYRKRLCADKHRSTPVGADGKIFIADRNGTVFVLKAGKQLEVLAKNELNEETTASPAISNGTIFIRTYDALYAFADTEVAVKKKDDEQKFAIAIHGGAGSSAKGVPPELVEKRKASLRKALNQGRDILSKGGSALDAVEAVIQILEDDPQFNAGKGAVFNAVGSHELDASIMDGSDKSCGAVAGVSHVKNPIALARLVMTETRHVLLSGEGAEEFAKQQNVERVEPSYFDTERSKKSWERYNRRNKQSNLLGPHHSVQGESSWKMGTVGCVALDSHGNLAAGTSTGGMTNKQFGRIGDSPIVGAGTYADNATCAVSATGIGEQYIRNAIAYDVSAQMKYKGATLMEALDDNLTNRLNPGDGGLIAVDHDGNIAMGFNTQGMARAAADSNGRFEVIWGN